MQLKNFLKGIFLFLLIATISQQSFSQSSAKGSLETVDTLLTRPLTYRLAVNRLDKLVYYWNLKYWFLVQTANSGGGELWTENGSDIYRSSKVAVNTTTADSTFKVNGTANITGRATINGIRFKITEPFTGFNGMSIGLGAGPADVGYTGSQNHFIGTLSGNTITTGTQNTGVGYATFFNATGVGASVAIGHTALRSATGGNYNVAIGYLAMSANGGAGAGNSGSSNIAIGRNALLNNTSGSQNLGSGQSTLSSNTTGSNNVSLGYLAGNTNTTGSGNIYIGANVTGVAARDNQLSIGGWITGASGRISINALADSTEQLTVGGNIKLATAGNKLMIATGANASAGTATLSSGSVTVNTTAVTASSIIIACYGSQGAGVVAMFQPGHIYVDSQTAGTSFVIRSTNGSDNSTVSWWIIN